MYDDVVDVNDDDYQHDDIDYLLHEPQQDQEFTIKKKKSVKSGCKNGGRLRMKNRKKVRICNVCGERLKSEASLNKHLLDKHQIQGKDLS